LLNRATIAIDDLPDGYLALTLGTTITVDTDAAGYGWFVDQTPFLNEEFVSGPSFVNGHSSFGSEDSRLTLDDWRLTTADETPWQLVAKADGPADGKMDLLTVLMHELGHVMNLGHVSSAVDGTRLMAGSIAPGIRRLPSLLDLGMVETTPDASPLTPDQSQIWDPYMAHYTPANSHKLSAMNSLNLTSVLTSTLWAAKLPSHEGIFNSNFANNDEQSADNGWDRSGAVTIANGQAVLSEDSNVISTLSQLFTLPAGSTHLRFTLLDLNLVGTGTGTSPAAGASPQDGFEVALLEASTMTPLAGIVDGLTQTDSLLNIQADGTIYTSPLVTVTPLNSALLVDVDLTGLPAGTAARLSFDLLGFGDRTSTVTIDNVLLTDGAPTAAPVAADDSYTVSEDDSIPSPQSSGLLSNDSDPDTALTGLSALLVAGPQYGTVTLNADGSFIYVHDGGESLTDAFTYQVSDGINLSNVATVSFLVSPVNDAPVLAPIAPHMVEQGRTLTFTATATDPDDSNLSPESSALTYSLGLDAPSGASIDPTTGLFAWAVPVMYPLGVMTFTVQVTDAALPPLTASQAVTVTVEVMEQTNTPPVLDPIGNKMVDEESRLVFTLSATDPDLSALVYSAAGLPVGAIFDETSGFFDWTPSETQGGADYVMTFSVNDGEFSDSEMITITVNEVNKAPALDPIVNQTVNEGDLLAFSISASDADDPVQLLTYSATDLPLGATFDLLTQEFVWTPTEVQGPGSYDVTFSVSDGVVTTSQLVTITVNEVNVAPVLGPIGNKTVNEETELRLTISGSDVDDPFQTLVYSAAGLPLGATFDPLTQEFVWTPSETQGPGSYAVTFSVTDGVVTTSELVTITVNEVNVAPVLNAIGNQTVNEEIELRFTISGSDVDDPAQPLTHSATGLPLGATFDPLTQEFVWTPAENQGPGSYAVTFSVTDGVVTTSETITITVGEVNVAPVLDPIGNQTVDEGSLLTFTVSASDVDWPVQTLTYSLAPGARVGATINANTGLFTWTPTEDPRMSSSSVTFNVSDGVVTTSETIAITVLNVTPTVSLIPATSVQEGVSAIYAIQFQDPGILDTHQVQINWGDGSVVEVITSTADASAGVSIPRSHTYGDGGLYTITVTVTDDEGASGSASATISVANVAPAMTLTPATQTVQYSDPIAPIVITATDVMADTLNVTTAWSTTCTTFTAGLPDALTLTGGLALTGAANQVGTVSWAISGIADLDPAQVYTLRVTVTDEDGGTTVQQAVIDPTPEDVQATYTGPLLMSTADINTSTATVMLRATIQDITAVSPGTDPDAGAVTQATVTFVNRDTGTIIAEQVPVAVLDPMNPSTGVAGYDWTVDLGNQDAESYTIGVLVNGFYRRDSALDNTVVTVSKPLPNFITGGGYLLNQSSAGLYAGDQGEKTNFGFNVKFNKQLTNIQGKVNIIIRQQGHVYQIRTNSTESLVIQAVDPLAQQAVITAKANLKDITDPLNPITLSGNLDLIATVTDRGEPGTSDTVAFTLWKNNTLWYASAWNGVQMIEQVLAGGNIQAHTNPQALTLDESQRMFQTSMQGLLTLDQTGLLVVAAQTQWIQGGLVLETAALNAIEVRIADLPDATLAWTLGSTIWLDADAAGQGWFVDSTPFTHEEFISQPRVSSFGFRVSSDQAGLPQPKTRNAQLFTHSDSTSWQLTALEGSAAYGRVDLLTTVLHEMGHVLGYEDQQVMNLAHATLMTETLPVGVRRLPFGCDGGLSGSEPSFVSGNSPRTIHNSTLGGGTASPVTSYVSPFTSDENLVGKLLFGTGESFMGLWGAIGSSQGQSSRPDTVVPRIEWGDDEERVDLTESITITTTSTKPSWLSRFLFHTGREAVKSHDDGIEVVLPGRK